LIIRNAQNVDYRTSPLGAAKQTASHQVKFFPQMDRLIGEMERNTVQEALQFLL